jgi:hypothetical protein
MKELLSDVYQQVRVTNLFASTLVRMRCGQSTVWRFLALNDRFFDC